MTGPDSDGRPPEPDQPPPHHDERPPEPDRQPDAPDEALTAEANAEPLTSEPPSAEANADANADATTEAPADPLGRIFTLEDRRAPGLYLVAWILAVGGLVLTFLIGPMASAETARNILVGVGALMVTLGFAAGAGSQVLERSVRDPDRYRGPAPVLVFAAYFFAMSLVGLVLIVGLRVDSESPFNFLGIGVVQTCGMALAVWLFAVRTDALTWRQMGWPTRQGTGLRRTLRGIGVAAGVMLPVTFGIVILGGIVGLIVGVDAPQVLPLSETALDGFFVVLSAAIIIPIGEELFFRGFALTAWMRDLGARTALIRSTVFFAVIHILNIHDGSIAEMLGQVVLVLVVILPVGYTLGRLFLRHGMAGAIGGHVTYNSLLLILAYAASRIPDPV